MPDDATLKQRVHSSDLAIGVSAPMNSSRSRLEEILGADSYDFVSIDSQHSPFNEERLVEFCLMAQDIGIPVHFRIKHTRFTFQVGNYLDLGPTAIEVPQTETEETAQEAVDFFHYRQFGRRSWGGAPRVGVAERPDRLEYAAWWNNYGVLWLQVESLQAISNIPRLVRPGVDGISWGPADLSFDREANAQHPLAVSDDACVQHAVKLLEGTDAELLVRSYDWKLRQKYQDMGVTNLLESPKA